MGRDDTAYDGAVRIRIAEHADRLPERFLVIGQIVRGSPQAERYRILRRYLYTVSQNYGRMHGGHFDRVAARPADSGGNFSVRDVVLNRLEEFLGSRLCAGCSIFRG